MEHGNEVRLAGVGDDLHGCLAMLSPEFVSRTKARALLNLAAGRLPKTYAVIALVLNVKIV
jgi:hypothetical protein